MNNFIHITANNSGFDIELGQEESWSGFEVGGLGLQAWLKPESASIKFCLNRGDIASELQASPISETGPKGLTPVFEVKSRDQLYHLLSRACILGHTLPNQALYDFEKQVDEEVKNKGISSTEAIAEVKRRVGQDRYRKALMDYWGGTCAVTDVTNSTLLKASHAKGWANCESDAERLDIYNGFLLNVNLDCVFDAGLISFDDQGCILISSSLSQSDLAALNITQDMRLKKIHDQHRVYLEWHWHNKLVK